MACISLCHKNAIHIEDKLKSYNAIIDENICVNCGKCEKVCQINYPIEKTEPILWKQGWALDENIRKRSSSGGLASALSNCVVEDEGVVCSCTFKKGEFVFEFASTSEDISKFSGSKYIKSNPHGVYEKLKGLLDGGKKVLFIGLPCQVAALKKYVKDHHLLYTVDLICHGTPSPQNLNMFLSEKKYQIEKMEDITFRQKIRFYLSDGKKSIEPPSVMDRYTLAFLKALCYTEICYSCQYATTARVSDISLGDSWGTELPVQEQEKGISLVLCQTQKGKELLDMAEIHLENVDVNIAIANNRQLNFPSSKPPEYELFFSVLEKRNSFSNAVYRCYPKICFRQKVKSLLVKMRIISR